MDYKKYYKCKKCKRIYGSDLINDNGLCPICNKGKHKIRRSWKNAFRKSKNN